MDLSLGLSFRICRFPRGQTSIPSLHSAVDLPAHLPCSCRPLDLVCLARLFCLRFVFIVFAVHFNTTPCRRAPPVGLLHLVPRRRPWSPRRRLKMYMPPLVLVCLLLCHLKVKKYGYNPSTILLPSPWLRTYLQVSNLLTELPRLHNNHRRLLLRPAYRSSLRAAPWSRRQSQPSHHQARHRCLALTREAQACLAV